MLDAVSTANPATPIALAAVPIGFTGGLALDTNVLYGVDRALVVVNHGTIATPMQVQAVPLRSNPERLAMGGNHVYVAARGGNLFVVRAFHRDVP